MQICQLGADKHGADEHDAALDPADDSHACLFWCSNSCHHCERCNWLFLDEWLWSEIQRILSGAAPRTPRIKVSDSLSYGTHMLHVLCMHTCRVESRDRILQFGEVYTCVYVLNRSGEIRSNKLVHVIPRMCVGAYLPLKSHQISTRFGYGLFCSFFTSDALGSEELCVAFDLKTSFPSIYPYHPIPTTAVSWKMLTSWNSLESVVRKSGRALVAPCGGAVRKNQHSLRAVGLSNLKTPTSKHDINDIIFVDILLDHVISHLYHHSMTDLTLTSSSTQAVSPRLTAYHGSPRCTYHASWLQLLPGVKLENWFKSEKNSGNDDKATTWWWLWKMTIEIVDFPIQKWSFPIAMLVYQRVRGSSTAQGLKVHRAYDTRTVTAYITLFNLSKKKYHLLEPLFLPTRIITYPQLGNLPIPGSQD